MEWGNEIAVNGVRPDWLEPDCDRLAYKRDNNDLWFGPEPVDPDFWSERDIHRNSWGWRNVEAIRLPADHAYYVVERYNEQHGTSFVYWPGGDAAPADWDSGPVLLRAETPSGVIIYGAPVAYWTNEQSVGDAIGYTRRSEPTRDTVAVERRTAKEWTEYCKKVSGSTFLTTDELEMFKALGLVIETEAERIAAETGVPVETVQRVLDARS